MSRPNPGKLAAVLVAAILLAALPVLVKGGLYFTNYEGDALHLADIALRMAAGERAHLDFMTPLGSLAFWPVALGLRAGADLGLAFVLGQTGFALLAAIGVWWAAWSRLPPRLAYAFVLVSAVLLTSLSHGASGGMVAISMHYNRWAWVLAFVAVLLCTLRPRGEPRPAVDGTVVAAAMAGMAFLKATYVVAFAPALLLVLLARRDWRLLGAAVVAGAVLAAAIALLLGPAAILAYIADLSAVAAGEIRNQPGLSFADIVVSPAYLVGTLTALAGIAILRRSGASAEGLALLILLPAFLYVTWQNFGNDPVWLVLLWILLFALRPRRRAALPPEKDPSVSLFLAAFAALVLSVPLLQNHAMGGLRMLTLDAGAYVPLVSGREGLGDLYMPALPAHLVRGRENLTEPGEPYAVLADLLPTQEPARFGGGIVPGCQIVTGIQGSLATIAAELAPEEGPVFVADLISSHWLYGAGAPLPGAAPWNYGTLSGIGAARHVLVPLCAIDTRARDAILGRLEAEGPPLALARETPLFRLYEIGG